MLWLHFGEWREVPARKGGVRRVGEWTLHIQTPWNLVRDDRVIVGSRDLYYYGEGSAEFAEGSEFDWNKDGESRFDRQAAALNLEFESKSPLVTKIACDTVGMFSLTMGDEMILNVLPNCASSSPDFEFWRLFQAGTDAPHYVVATMAG